MKPTKPDRDSRSLLFLKLGGSLITDKTQPRRERPGVIQRLAEEIAGAFHANPELRLVLGHGSGSFGHYPARKYQTRQGVHSPSDWLGFAAVWEAAATLNHIMMDALHKVGLPGIAFPPSASIVCSEGRISSWELHPLRSALSGGLIPVVYGDVTFDQRWGGTILSTEDLFNHLARILHPRKILSAGLEDGVWADYPTCTHLFPKLTPADLPQILSSLHGSHGTDVTGGMISKVQLSMDLVKAIPGLEVLIFSGKIPGNLRTTLLGSQQGTLIVAG